MTNWFNNTFRITYLVKELWQNFRLVWRLFFDSRVPIGPKIIVPATLLYLVFPIDFLPDLIPGLGQLDDLAVLLVGLRLFVEMIPRHLVEEHLAALRFNRGAGNSGQQQGASPAQPIEGDYRVVDDANRAR